MQRLLVLLVILATAHPSDQAAFEKEERLWREQRAARLRAEDGWLSLIGLDWLKEGRNPLKLPGGPSGDILLRGDSIILKPVAHSGLTIDGQAVRGAVALKHDAAAGGPTVVRRGSVRFQIIKRNDRFAVRIKDAASEALRSFRGMQYFPADPKWRLRARFEPYNPPRKIPITSVLGMTSDEISPGALVFRVGGKEYRLDPILEQGETDLFLIIKDQTSRDLTYPAARYLYAAPPGPDGTTVIDFNRAYNPPCAFTPFATCPLPPRQNVLPFRIEAGEKRYAGSHH